MYLASRSASRLTRSPSRRSARVVDARMGGVGVTCDYVRGGGVEVKVAAIMDVERGPASRGNRAELPWFLAVTSGDDSQLVQRKNALLSVNFEGNQTRSRVTSAPESIMFPAGRNPADVTGACYVTITLDENESRAVERIDHFFEQYYNRPPEAMKRRSAIYAGSAAGAAEWLAGYADAGVEHFVLRFAGDGERQLEQFAKIRSNLGW